MPETPPEPSPDAPNDGPNAADLPPAYFLSLTLENVRCFGPEQTLDLSDGDGNWAQWTVILGDNGTGKTTLLQSVADMVPVESFFSSVERPTIGPKQVHDRANHSRKRTMRLDYAPAVLRTRLVKEKEVYKYDSRVHRENKYGIQTGGGRDLLFESGQIEFQMNLFAYGANRSMEKGGFEETDKQGDKGLFDDEFALPNAQDWLLQTDYAARRGKETAQDRIDQILAVLADILPDVEEVQIKEQEGDTALPKVEFHTPYGWVTMDQLSLGYRTMIAWIVDLARRLFERYPDMENPLEGPAVCLVDEIDLHLHPKWQRRIIGFLSERFPNTQFIVTAHSPLIVQAAQDANIAVLKRSDKPDETGAHYVEIHNDLEPLRNLRVDQILTSDLYGLDSARPPQIEHLVEEKIQLLSKSTLTEEDEARLEELDDEIGFMPAGETPEEREALKILNDISSRIESSSD